MLFKNITILDENFETQENMYVGVQGDSISYIGKDNPQEQGKDFGETIDGKGKLLMPGFYNAHAHSPMSLMRGYGENLKLQDWLFTKIFPFEDKLDDNAVYWATLLCNLESLRYGIVSSSDMYYFMDAMARAVSASGIKANLSRSLVALDGVKFDDMPSVLEMKQAISSYHGAENGRILMDTSLHAEYTSNETLARELAAFTKEAGLRMHVHVAETKLESEECKERHQGKTVVRYLSDCGLFDVPAIAAHCVWIEGDDYDILREKGVTVATNPVSNMKLASGIAPTAEMLKRGVKLAIGTDSVSSNNSLNFIEEIKTLALCSKVQAQDPTVMSPKEALYAATRAGALAQGREDCGIMKVGYKADLICLDITGPNMHPVHNLANNIVYSADGGSVCMTMVDGKVLYKDGEYVTIDKKKTVYEANRAMNGILAQL